MIRLINFIVNFGPDLICQVIAEESLLGWERMCFSNMYSICLLINALEDELDIYIFVVCLKLNRIKSFSCTSV